MKEKSKDIYLGKLEFVFEPGFEKDWASVLATYIYHEIKEELELEMEGGPR